MLGLYHDFYGVDCFIYKYRMYQEYYIMNYDDLFTDEICTYWCDSYESKESFEIFKQRLLEYLFYEIGFVDISYMDIIYFNDIIYTINRTSLNYNINYKYSHLYLLCSHIAPHQYDQTSKNLMYYLKDKKIFTNIFEDFELRYLFIKWVIITQIILS